ncbi:MAG: FmdE family protein [Pyrinomonadaceae bacterium]
MQNTVDELLGECAVIHGHICPGQLLGVRMALAGCELIGVEDPKGADRKKLIVWVEIDRCVTDAISAVTGARIGRRSLKVVDYGKVAATFLNQETRVAFRIVARDESRALADALHPEVASKKDRQMLAYREASNEQLFKFESVNVELSKFDHPGKPLTRVSCAKCAEGINDGRELRGSDGSMLCKPCAEGGYYQVV